MTDIKHPIPPFRTFRDMRNDRTLNHHPEIPEDDKEVRCFHCARIHKVSQSLFIPLKMEEVEGNDVFIGEGYYDSFECAYRVLLNNLGNIHHARYSEYRSSEPLLLYLFDQQHPGQKLKPAPQPYEMDVAWLPEYAMVPLPGTFLERSRRTYATYAL